jgi:polyribonucleotide nucleotidyltransferase
MGDTVALVTAVTTDTPKEGANFLPLVVNQLERAFAAGKIPGGFFKREGRPTERETLISRLIDRSIRPLFPDGYRHDTQIIISVFSADQENDPDILGMLGASCALHISRIPFEGPIGAVRIGYIDGQCVVNPTALQQQESVLNIIAAGTKDSINMVEAGAREVSEEVILEALTLAQEEIRKMVAVQEEMRAALGKEKLAFIPDVPDSDLKARAEKDFSARIAQAITVQGKETRQKALDQIKEEAVSQYSDLDEEALAGLSEILKDIEKKEARRIIAQEGRRVDGRALDEIRPISGEVGFLPRAHGSGLFTRGETQALVVTTLGTAEDEQRVDDLGINTSKSFMLHYNFPPFSTGEASFLRGPSRREIGHGALAERALQPSIPAEESFPYTIRVVSDILESNGSSSMATVCGTTLSLMDAGVPISTPIAGIAMGLVKEGDGCYVLSDILGLEDHYGDMDFKVAGSRQGITALQMDIKIAGITPDILKTALYQARDGRLFILDKMLETIAEPRESISVYAPRIITMRINVEKIRDVIGPGGKTIRSIIDQTGVKINVEDDGTVSIASADEEAAAQALAIIEEIVQEAEVGKVYLGKVKKVVDFGAFVEIFPGTEGLVHISQLANYRVQNVTDEINEGDEVMVKVIAIDREGKIKLSRKEALAEKKRDKVTS